MNQKPAATFFYYKGESSNRKKPSDTPGNIFNIDESGIHINSKPYSVITDKVSKNVCVLTSEEKSENITVIACMLLFCMSISAPCSNIQGLHQETGVR